MNFRTAWDIRKNGPDKFVVLKPKTHRNMVVLNKLGLTAMEVADILISIQEKVFEG